MALIPGTRLGAYEIQAALGAGAMGEVYRATDTNLKRQVALKVLPASVANDVDRLARFQREAEVLATLNHPNIAAIHGLERSTGATALVMEFVEGEDLSARIKRGAIPLDEVLPIARQIAEALEAAHEAGIIHRDLKPANIKVRPDATVKVLDFGLAKALGSKWADGDQSKSPTITKPAMTEAGVILGTFAYMSPEQAKGRPADQRADIWAFGVVVFEMLAGRRPFIGETMSDTLASVLKTEPQWGDLPAATPAGLRRLLRWCLEKNTKRRLQAIGDARVQIEDLISGTSDETVVTRHAVPRRRLIAAASVAFVAGTAAALVTTWAVTRPASAKLQAVRFAIVPPPAQPLHISPAGSRDLAVSPGGTHLVYLGGVAGENQLLLRGLDQLDATTVSGTRGVNGPFFSPDGRWIGYFAGALGGQLQKVSVTGGPPVPLSRTRGNSGGASWGPDDTIVFATMPATGVGLLRVPAAGGEPTVLTTLDVARDEQAHLFPSVLPGGRAVLFTITSGGPIENAQVAVVDLTTSERKTLIRGGRAAEYVEPGYLVYVAAGALHAVRFDPVKLLVLSDPVRVLESVRTLATGAAEFSVSRQGTLVYIPGRDAETPVSLAWVDRQGHEESIAAPARAYQMPRLSPDGMRVAVSTGDQDLDIWIWDFARHTLTRLTDTPGSDWYPVWTPDGRRIVFASARVGPTLNNVFWQAADNTGTAERLTTSPNRQGPGAISPDGARLIVQENLPKTGWDLRVLRLDARSGPSEARASAQLAGDSSATESLVQTPAAELHGELSPDGHWLAYQSDESGQNQVFVRPFPDVNGGRWQISTSGGITPVWARDGNELFYLDQTNALISVPIQTAPTFSAGRPTKLFKGPYVSSPFWRTFDVSPDSQRFLMIKDNTDDRSTAPASMVVVLNWFEELNARVPAGK